MLSSLLPLPLIFNNGTKRSIWENIDELFHCALTFYITSLLAINLKVNRHLFSQLPIVFFFLSFLQQFNTTSKRTLFRDKAVIFQESEVEIWLWFLIWIRRFVISSALLSTLINTKNNKNKSNTLNYPAKYCFYSVIQLDGSIDGSIF